MGDDFIVSTLPQPPQDWIVRTDFGIVSGTSMMSRQALFDAFAKFQSWVGGKVSAYEKPTREGMANAYIELVEKAQQLDTAVNAVLGVQLNTFEVGEDIIGVVLLGTAVQVEQE